MVAPTLADLRYAFFGGGPGKTVSDAEYIQLKAMYDSGISLSQLSASSPTPPVGELESIPRSDIESMASPIASGTVVFTHFIAQRTQVVGRMTMYSGTAAGATPSIVQWGIYEVETDGDCILLASIANDTALFAGANTEYIRALTANVSLLAGKRYALGVLVITAAALPTVMGTPAVHAIAAPPMKQYPPVATQSTGHASLPASVANVSQNGTNGNRQYARLLLPA